ncbi:MAG: metallophosphoesterase [Pseudomonadota bacterium]
MTIYGFEADREVLGPEGGDVRLRFSVIRATHLRVVCEQDGHTVCDGTGPCEVVSTLTEGEVMVQPAFEKTSYRLEASDGVSTQFARVELTLRRPTFPDWPYNEISLWILSHRPLAPPFTFAVINDSQPATDCPVAERPDYVQMRERIAELAPDFVMSIGDVVIYGQACEWEPYVANTLHRFVDEMGIPWITAPGNHELINHAGPENFARFAGAEDFWFDVAGLRVISLNAYHRLDPEVWLVDEDQLAFLENRIATSVDEGIHDVVLAMHYPPYTPTQAGSCGHFLLNQYEGHFFDQRSAYRGSGEVLQLLETHAPPVSLGLFGHVHVFGHYERSGVHHVVSGGGGAHFCAAGEYDARDDPDATLPFRDGIFHHFLLVTVRSSGGGDIAVQVFRAGESDPVDGYSFEL